MYVCVMTQITWLQSCEYASIVWEEADAADDALVVGRGSLHVIGTDLAISGGLLAQLLGLVSLSSFAEQHVLG